MVEKKLTPAVAYVRMSSDKQQDSPARQRADITAMANREGFTITRWYEDHGKTGTEAKKRPDFQKLLADATAGKIEAVLMSEQSRMSREDLFAQMAYWKLLRDAGVTVMTCQRGRMDFENLGGLLASIVDAHGAHDESRKIAERVASGKRLAMSKGRFQGGRGVFGLDREVRDPEGNVLRRVHFRERFQKPPGYTAHFVPSNDAKAVAAVRDAFKAIVAGETVAEVRKWFDGRGLLSVDGNHFYHSDVTRILRNQMYCGTLILGRLCGAKSKFARAFADGPRTLHNVIEPIITRELFDKVQAILQGRRKVRASSVPGRYLLVGLIKCGVCGGRMYGHQDSLYKGGAKLGYSCLHLRRFDDPTSPHRNAPRPCVDATTVEEAVFSVIRNKVFTPENCKAIQQRIADRNREKRQTSVVDEQRLAELQADITRGEKNLARASTDADYAAVSGTLAEWRKEAESLRMRLKDLRPSGSLTAEAKEAIEKLEWVTQNLGKVSRRRLADCLKQLVHSIEIRRPELGSLMGSKLDAVVGEIRFAPDIYPDPIPIAEELLAVRVQNVLKCLRDRGEVMSSDDLAVALGICRRSAHLSAIKAHKLGLLKAEQEPKPYAHTVRIWAAV